MRDVRLAQAVWYTIRRRLAPIGAALVVVGIALPLHIWPILSVSGQSTAATYDEGVYWASLRAMAAGGNLFSGIFSSQPPGFLLCIYPFYLLFGQTLMAARMAIIVYSLLGILAAYYIGRFAGGPWAGASACVLLALDPLYAEQSRLVHAEIPSLALMLTAVALAAEASRQVGPWKRRLASACGVALGLSIMDKVFTVIALVPVLLYIAWPAFVVSGTVDAGDEWLRSRGLPWRTLASSLIRLVAGILFACLVVLVPYVNVLPDVYNQSIAFHLAAGHALNQGTGYNLSLIDLIGRQRGEYWLACAALAGAVLTLWRRSWTVIPPLAWFVASLLVLLRQQPLYDHHLVLLVPPLAIAAGLAWPAALLDVRQVGLARMLASGSGGQRGLASGVTKAVALSSTLVLLLAVCYASVAVDIRLDRQATKPLAGEQVQMVAALRDRTSPTDLIVSDDQGLVAQAGRNSPPNLVDTSATRIKSGYLTSASIEEIIARSHVRGILFASGRFDLLPGFRAWVSAHFPQELTFDQGHALYLTP